MAGKGRRPAVHELALHVRRPTTSSGRTGIAPSPGGEWRRYRNRGVPRNRLAGATRGMRTRWRDGGALLVAGGSGCGDGRLLGLALPVRGVRMPTQHEQHRQEADHVREHNVPALTKPLPGVLCLREGIGQRDPGRRPEPDHAPTEAHRVSEEAPVVAALVQAQLRQRNVVEHR